MFLAGFGIVFSGFMIGFYIKQILEGSREEPVAQEEQESSSKDHSFRENLLCPISQTTMTNPFIVRKCGHTFEKEQISL